jgi:hypothetical protein
MGDSSCDNLTESLIADTIGVLTLYMNQIDKLHPHAVAPPQSAAQTSEDDSQGSLGVSVNMDRQMMIFVSLRNIPFNLLMLTPDSRCPKKSSYASAN